MTCRPGSAIQKQDPPETYPMTITAAALVYTMVAWINSTGMITPVLPDAQLEVNITTRYGMASDILRCYDAKDVPPPSYSDALRAAQGMHGLYCADRVTLHDDIDLEGPEGQAWMIHELVHWLQDHNGDADEPECRAALEADAYKIHMHWQEYMGIPVYPDEFTAMARSACGRTFE